MQGCFVLHCAMLQGVWAAVARVAEGSLHLLESEWIQCSFAPHSALCARAAGLCACDCCISC
jgi:hypothetical protein